MKRYVIEAHPDSHTYPRDVVITPHGEGPFVYANDAQAIIDEAVKLLDAWEDHDFRVCAEVDPEDEPPCGDCYMCRTRDFIAKHGKDTP